MNTTHDQSNDWATPSLKEAPFWREGMSPQEYDTEREYLGRNFHLILEGKYQPLWKQQNQH